MGSNPVGRASLIKYLILLMFKRLKIPIIPIIIPNLSHRVIAQKIRDLRETGIARFAWPEPNFTEDTATVPQES